MTQQLSDIDWVMSTYSEVFDIMSKADRDEWNKQYDLLSLSLKEKKDELMNKQNLIIRAAENGISLPSNLDYEDTVKEYARLVGTSVAEAQRMAAADEITGLVIGDAPISGNTLAVLQEIQLLAGLTPSEKQNVNAELARLGFGSETAPDWFRKQVDTERQETTHPNVSNSMWNDYRNRILGREPETVDEDTIPPPPDYIESFSAYEEDGWTREQVENSWISQYNETQPAANKLKNIKELHKRFPDIRKALDDVYETSRWEKFVRFFK